jgi:diguanylate cyclase (GGDEF)-like protein
MESQHPSAQTPDRHISINLLHNILTACKAAFFYHPIVETADAVQTPGQISPEDGWSLNMGTLYGLTDEPRNSLELMALVHEADREKLMQVPLQLLARNSNEDACEYRVARADGEHWMLSRFFVGRSDDGKPEYLASMTFDITEQKRGQAHLTRANSQLARAQGYLQSALSVSGIAIFRQSIKAQPTDADEYETWNFNMAKLYGYPPHTLMTHELQLSRMRPEDVEDLITMVMGATGSGRVEFQHEYPIIWEDQSQHHMLAKYHIEFDARGEQEFIAGAVIDITDRKIAEERVQFVATHDVLTSLPNRFMFNNLLNHTIETARRYSNRFAIFFIDLDRFKSINDALGHQAGDQLLIETAKRLRKCLRTSDILARISGDEFMVLAPQMENENDAGIVARKIIAEVSEPLNISSHRCQVTASVGICFFPDHGNDEQTLIRNADSAMYVAKEAGKNNYQIFNSSSTSQSLERMAIENELRSALLNNEFTLQYQAKLDLRNDRITGVEALLRWHNPKFGNVSPAQFIPMTEETGLIVPIGRWVLMTACKQNVEWQKQGLPAICVAVNISARQFMSKDFLGDIRDALGESGMAPELLELEITESMVMHHVDQAVALLSEIKQMGVRIAIDDFGTGYSSLAQLKRFPIDTLKVDRSFIREVVHDADDQAITDAVIALGKSLSLTIIAEGVETKEQQDFLRKHSCDEMQGFYFSKPVPPAEFSELLARHSGTSRP